MRVTPFAIAVVVIFGIQNEFFFFPDSLVKKAARRPFQTLRQRGCFKEMADSSKALSSQTRSGMKSTQWLNMSVPRLLASAIERY